MFQQVFTSNLLLCFLFIVTDFLQTFLDLKLSTQGIIKRV